MAEINLIVNGEARSVPARPETTLLDVIREGLGLRGTKSSCERAVCGACTTLLDGVPVASCSVFAFECDGREVETIEGLSKGGELSYVQSAFLQSTAFQCGYCTPGMVMLVTALLRDVTHPSRSVIREWLESNICRCTGYEMIFEAVERAVKLRDEGV